MPSRKRRRATDRTIRANTRRKTRLHSAAESAVLPRPAVSPEAWRNSRPKFVAGAISILLVAALFAFFNADQFYIFDFDVAGTRYLTKPEVEHASGVVGYNIFFVEPQVVERALGRLPEVKSVRVTPSIPHNLSIEIEERLPELTWIRGNETYWVDADGVAFRARSSLAELPAVRDLDQASVQPGQPLQSDGFAAVKALLSAWADAPHSLEWSFARGLTFTDERGWAIYLGDANEMAGKLAKYRALVAQLLAQNARVRFIDLGKGDPYYQ